MALVKVPLFQYQYQSPNQRQWKRLFRFQNFGRFRDVSVSFTFVSFFRSQTFPKMKIFQDNRETKRNDCYISGTRKETTFLERGYFKKRKRKRKVVSTISAPNHSKYKTLLPHTQNLNLCFSTLDQCGVWIPTVHIIIYLVS